MLPGFNALSFIAPDPVGLRCNTIFRAHGFYADFLGLFESLKSLFRRMVLFRLDSSGLVAPLPVSLVADVILAQTAFMPFFSPSLTIASFSFSVKRGAPPFDMSLSFKTKS